MDAELVEPVGEGSGDIHFVNGLLDVIEAFEIVTASLGRNLLRQFTLQARAANDTGDRCPAGCARRIAAGIMLRTGINTTTAGRNTSRIRFTRLATQNGR